VNDYRLLGADFPWIGRLARADCCLVRCKEQRERERERRERAAVRKGGFCVCGVFPCSHMCF